MISQGLYTSNEWILFIERDSEHPWIFAISGVAEKSKQVFYREVCEVKDGMVPWRGYHLFSSMRKVFIWNKQEFQGKTQLYFRCPKSEKFPLHLSDVLISDKKVTGSSISLHFANLSNGLQVKSVCQTADPSQMAFKVHVLCKSLLVMQAGSVLWLLYLHSDLAFFCFNHPQLEFGDSFHIKT